MTRTDTALAWTAGFFEGEGWVTYTPGQTSPRVGIGNTCVQSLRRVQANVGMGTITGPRSRGTNKPMYAWTINGWEHVSYAYGLMIPWLSDRRILQFEQVLANAPTLAKRDLKANFSGSCRRGHTWNEENTYWYLRRNGRVARTCKACWRVNHVSSTEFATGAR